MAKTVEAVAQAIREKIGSDPRFTVGRKAPSGRSLELELGASRMTVQRAIRRLVEEGLLEEGERSGRLIKGKPIEGAIPNPTTTDASKRKDLLELYGWIEELACDVASEPSFDRRFDEDVSRVAEIQRATNEAESAIKRWNALLREGPTDEEKRLHIKEIRTFHDAIYGLSKNVLARDLFKRMRDLLEAELRGHVAEVYSGKNWPKLGLAMLKVASCIRERDGRGARSNGRTYTRQLADAAAEAWSTKDTSKYVLTEADMQEAHEAAMKGTFEFEEEGVRGMQEAEVRSTGRRNAV